MIKDGIRQRSHFAEEIGQHSGQAVNQLTILSAAERERVVYQNNDTDRPYPRDRLIHELFEAQVLRTPEAVAVEYLGSSLTYVELNRKANKLARHLRCHGIGPDQLVGLYVNRSLEMVIGLLGILKAGGAYVPLDPSYPIERLQYMLADAAPRVLLVQEELWKTRGTRVDAQVVALDRDSPDISQQSSENLKPAEIRLTDRNLSYVIYTSGSTGRPKGAMNEHRGVVNRLQWMQDEYQLNANDRVLQKTPFSFDVSVWEFFWTLLSGARLVIARPLGHQDPAYLRQLIDHSGVTTLHFVPSMLQIFLNQLQDGSCATLKRIVCSGEELPLALHNKCLASLPNARLCNLYGPTEAAIDVTAWECKPDPAAKRVPIGRPIANIQMYVLDGRLQPVPVGVAGELYIGGVGVGRGYLGRQGLTAERFIADPFGSVRGAALYKTGDLARWRTDGAIEYLGRNDHQVKVRGVRIELGEIEARLTAHARVKDAVVIAREDIPGEKRLVAYITGTDGGVPTVDELRGDLRSALPEHMVPTAFVTLASMPLSPNGKLDRRALPAPDLSAFTSRPFEVPQGEREQVVANIWRDLLHVQRVSRHDNFLELGGHSLLIAQMIDRLYGAGLSADIKTVFQSQSLADLAGALRTGAVPTYEIPLNRIPAHCRDITPDMLTLVDLEPAHIATIVQAVPGGASNIQDIYPLAPLQEGMLFHCLLDEERGGSYVLALMLSVSSRAKLQELIVALQSVVDRHDALRTAVLWDQLPQPVQVVHRKATLPVEQIELNTRRNQVDQINTWLVAGRQRIDVREAPLVRLQIAEDPNENQWLALLQIHHLISDNESLDLLLQEARAHIEQCAQQLPDPVPYRNHVAWSLAQARGSDAEAFFRAKLGDVEATTAPFGLVDVQGMAERIVEARRSLSPALAMRVRSQARKLSVSPATLFHAAWALLIAHASARDDIVFGTVLLGRLHSAVGAQRALGMYINTLPLRLRLDSLTAKDLAQQVHAELINLVAHEQTSLTVAQRCSRVSGSAPLFSALLNYRHGPASGDAVASVAPGIQVVASQDRTNYPLSLSVDEYAEGFDLTMKIDCKIDPRKVLEYFSTALQSFVHALEDASNTPALSLSILSESDHRQIVESFNGTDADYPSEMLAHELFERQVQRTPDALAVIYQNQSLTYLQVNERANQLAHHLRRKGVGPDQRVGICVERGIDMIVGLLGIWKAGGAYVPLDPDYPNDRLTQIIEDASPRVVLIQEHLRTRVPTIGGAPLIIALDSQWPEIAACGGGDLDSRPFGLRSDHLAYVIYTSGSTGRPKGVMVEHRNVISLWQGLEQIYNQSGGCERIGVNASFNFDASVKQLIQILSGRTLVLIPQEVRLDAAHLLNSIDAQRLDGIDCTPSQLRAWIEAGLLDRKAHTLRVVLVGGEAIDPALWTRLAQYTAIDFYNVYGPTESTVDTTFARITGDLSASHIGRPMENRRVYLLDRRQQPVPIEVAGEIWIGGAGIARGYLNQPQLTAERFWRDPFSADPQARLYRTGDVGKWRADGTIEYLGRNDDQVKVRGFRIELGEIEAQLSIHPQIKQVAVVAHENGPGESRLIAYLAVHSNVPSAEALRSHMSSLLPNYMVPSAFIVMDTLPLTPSGKVDRRMLSRLAVEIATPERFEAPRGEVEEMLAAIWVTILGKSIVGRHDHFFRLGGHSLSAMKMIVRIRSALTLDVPLNLLFRYPVLSELSTQIESLLHQQLFEQLNSGEGYVDDLLEELAAMPDSKVQQLMMEMTTGDQA